MRDRAAVACLLALALAGCGGGDDDEAPPASTPAAPSATAPASTTAAAEPSDSTGTSSQAETTAASEPSAASSDAGPATLSLEPVAHGFDSPVLAISPPDDPRLFVVEQTGRIWILDGGQRSEQPFLDVTDRISSGGERGLLGLAFAPDFAQSGRFVVDYTNTDGDTRVVLYHADGDRADPDSGQELLAVDQPYPNHNGGNVVFGPDGKLWVGMGDGGSAGDPQDHAQDPKSPLGKLLRLDVDQPGSDPEMWALGLRNPWRFSFDADTDDIWIGDVGQGAIEEIDHVASDRPAGVNFGWRRFEGTQRYDDQPVPDDVVAPVAEYTHDDGCSVTGGHVIRDDGPLEGRYIYGDYCSGLVWTVPADGGEPTEVTDQLGGPVEGLTSFGLDPDGATLLVIQDGRILRLTAR